jgi:molybdopterin-guanine dinucleotide biosynthesis protein A
MLPELENTCAVVLAGGRARRMGGCDKGLVTLHGHSLAAHVIDALKPQAAEILVSANRNIEAYARLGPTVVPDLRQGFLGPLAGLHSALAHTDKPYVLAAPCDCPRPPSDLGARLRAALARNPDDVAVAHDGERLQPLFCLLSRALLPSLERALDQRRLGVQAWLLTQAHVAVDFSDQPQAFDNINSPELLAEHGAG